MANLRTLADKNNYNQWGVFNGEKIYSLKSSGWGANIITEKVLNDLIKYVNNFNSSEHINRNIKPIYLKGQFLKDNEGNYLGSKNNYNEFRKGVYDIVIGFNITI